MFELTLPRLALTPGARFAHFSNTSLYLINSLSLDVSLPQSHNQAPSSHQDHFNDQIPPHLAPTRKESTLTMAQTNTAPTSRAREKMGGDEEAAADLKLGEFQNVPTLTLSEARLLITSIIGHRKTQRNVTETECVLP